MKKIILIIFSIVFISASFCAWKVFGPAASVTDGKYFYIKSGSTYQEVKKNLAGKHGISPGWFELMAKRMNYQKAVKSGRYEIKKGMSIFRLIRMLKSGLQSPVNLVITKLRTKEDLARKVGNLFECDSLAMIDFLNTTDSIALYHLDSNILMTAVIPNTYSFFWNSTPGKIFRKLVAESEKFWTVERKQKAAAHELTPTEAYILASIVEEETRMKNDKGNIASVYLNRRALDMPLQADPTVKFALKDFSLRRIYHKHLVVVSPYNTYIVKGLPPGPICTPSIETIDELLNSTKTNYLYFVASSKFDGSSVFAATYKEHLKYAKAYHKALNAIDTNRKKE